MTPHDFDWPLVLAIAGLLALLALLATQGCSAPISALTRSAMPPRGGMGSV